MGINRAVVSTCPEIHHKEYIMKVAKNIPQQVVNKAKQVLNQYENGDIHARSISGGKKYLCLEVGHRYRLLNRGNKWELLSHEAYNSKKDW